MWETGARPSVGLEFAPPRPRLRRKRESSICSLPPEPTDIRNRSITPPPPPLPPPPQTGLTKLPAGGSVGFTNGAARPLWCGDLLTAGHQFTLDLLTECHALVADADATRFRPPQLIFLVRFSVHGAADSCLCIYDWKTNGKTSPWKQVDCETRTAEIRHDQRR